MLKMGTKVKRKGKNKIYTILNLGVGWAHVKHIHLTPLEELSNLTEYIAIDDLEEVEDD